MSESEEWRDIPGFGDHYQASNLGRIRAKARVVTKFYPSYGRSVNHPYAARILKLSRYCTSRTQKSERGVA